MNQYEAARLFYSTHTPLIMATPRNEWAGDPYAWEPYISLTPIEAWLWGDIRDANVILYPQYPIDRFFADFANPRAKVVVECDGAAYHKDKAKDAARDARMQELGWDVYRLTGRECRSETDQETRVHGVARQVIDAIGDHYGIKRRASGGRGVSGCHIDLLEHILKMNGVEA